MASGKTTKLELNTWTAEDFFRRDEFNENFTKIDAFATDALTVNDKGVAGGVASLDSAAKIPYAQIPDPALSVNAMSRQAIINGNFDVWQRGITTTNAGGYLADRWKMANNPDGGTIPSYTISRQSLTPGEILGSFYYERVNVIGDGASLGPGSNFIIEQAIENGTRSLCGLGKKITISFYARSSVAGKKIAVNVTQEYGSGGAPSAIEQMTGQTFSLTPTWTRYTLTLNTNTLVGKTFGTNNDDVTRVRFWYMWGANFLSRFGASTAETFVGAGDIDIAQVQVCAGDVALPFQTKSFAEELALCQRYAIAYTGTAVNSTIAAGHASSTTVGMVTLNIPVEMRNVPTLVATATDWLLSDGVTGTDISTIAIGATLSNSKVITLICTVAAGLTQFRPYRLVADGSANRLFLLDSEL